MRGIGYCRVSSKDQVEGSSLDEQERKIRAYAGLKGIELIDVLVDAAVSTRGRPIADRPEGGKLLGLVQARRIECVVVAKLDRAFRDTRDCLRSVDTWEKHEVGLHIVDLGGNSIDTQTPAGRFMLTVLAAAAEMERGMINDRCNSGREVARSRGQVLGSLPFGWCRGDDGKTLIPNEDEQQTLDLIGRLRDQGFTLRAVADDLNRRGLRAKRSTHWTHGAVAAVLRTQERRAA